MFKHNRESKKKLLIVVGMACWILVSILIQVHIANKKIKLRKEAEMFRQRVAAETAARQVKKVQVLVAARSIFSGAKIVLEDVAVREFPPDHIKPGAIPPHVNIVGVITRSHIFEGEQILSTKLEVPSEVR